MTTKEQERTALAKIRKIVDALGEDSYVGTALEGCLDIAAENIENDWACSMRQERDAAIRDRIDRETEIEVLQEKLAVLDRKAAESDEMISNLSARLNDEKHESNKWAARWNDERKDLKVECTDGFNDTKPVKKIEFFNHNGFRFINVTEPSGWTNSFKIDDLVKFEVS